PAASAPPRPQVSLFGWWTRRPLPPVSPPHARASRSSTRAGGSPGEALRVGTRPGKNYTPRVSLAERHGLGSIESHRIGWRPDVAPRLLRVSEEDWERQ